MTYEECLDIMFHSLPMYQREGKAAYKADLSRSLAIDEKFDHPHKHYKCIHIAGTNGKGSVSHMLASVLQEVGYKTGLYTSPHLKDFRERIKVNGEMISQAWILEYMQNNLSYFQEQEASFFEMTVALAFDYFKAKQVDFAVIETGMGGRLDSTNIIQPELSIITNIGLDHTSFLGNSISQIAGEKAGIIKTGVPVVSGSHDQIANQVFKKTAKERNTPIVFAKDTFKLHSLTLNQDQLELDYNFRGKTVSITSNLAGTYQSENISTVLTALSAKQTEWNITEANIEKGIRHTTKNTGLLGRWQKLSDSPKCFCDVAHNTEGLTHVIKQIKSYKYDKLIVVLGVVNDKNLEKILPLFPKEAHYIFTEAKIPRALPAEALMKTAQNFELNGELIHDVNEAYSKAKSISSPNDFIFVGGSTFTVAEIL